MAELFEPSNPLSMPFECFTYDSGLQPFPVRAHRHYFAELLLVREGTMLMGTDHAEYPVHSGEAFLVFPNETHAISSPEEAGVLYDVIKMDLGQFSDNPAYAPELSTVMEEAARQHATPWFSAESVHEMGLAEQIGACIREVGQMSFGYDLMIRSRLYMVLMQILREWMREGFKIRQRIFSSELHTSISSVTSYIEQHLRETLKVEELAAFCGMSYPAFSRKFRAMYGISCKDYIEQVRVARVEHFLLFTGCELNYICQETGYADCSHMIREFRRLRGTTPARFRASHRREEIGL